MRSAGVIVTSRAAPKWLSAFALLALVVMGYSALAPRTSPVPLTIPQTWFVHSGTPLVGLHGINGAPVFIHLFHSEREMYLALGVSPKKVDAYIEFQHKIHTPSWFGGVPVLETVNANAYLHYRPDAQWAYGLALGTSLATVTAAHANIHVNGGKASGITPPPTACTAYPNDNGCANAQPAVVGFTPGAIDTNFGYDVAQMGQVLPSANPGFAASLAAYTAVLHTVGDNEPYWDYAIGSSCNTSPGSCANINTFTPDGFCTWWSGSNAAGPLFASNPFLSGQNYFYCRETGGSPGLNYVLANWDVSDGGVDTTGIYIFPFNSNPHNIIFRNFYYLCTGPCVTTAQTTAGGFVYTPSASGSATPNVEFDFWTIDGGSPTGTGLPYATGNYFYKDGRSRQATTTMTYSLIKNLTGDPFQSGSGANGGDQNILRSVCFDCATNGAHGEWTEEGGVNFSRNNNYTGDIWFMAASYCAASCPSNQKKDMTSPIYDSGASNGLMFNNFIVHHNLNILSGLNCNTPGARVPPYNPDNVASGCLGGGDGSFFELNNTTRVQVGDFAGNFADREIGDIGCYLTGFGPVGARGFQAGSLTTVTAANTMSVTAVPSTPNTQAMIYPGAWLHSYAHNISFTGSIAANTLTASGVSQPGEYIIPGQTTISGSGFTSALVTAQLTGTTNGNGTYTINGSPQTITSRTMTGDDGFTDARMLAVYGVPEVGAGTFNPFGFFSGSNTTTTLTIGSPAGGLHMTSGSLLYPVDSNGLLSAGSRGTISTTGTGTSFAITSGVAYTGNYANTDLTTSCTPANQTGGGQNSCGTIVFATSGEPLLAQRDGQTWANYASFATINVSGTDPSYWYSLGLGQTTPAVVTFSGLNTPTGSCN